MIVIKNSNTWDETWPRNIPLCATLIHINRFLMMFFRDRNKWNEHESFQLNFMILKIVKFRLMPLKHSLLKNICKCIIKWFPFYQNGFKKWAINNIEKRKTIKKVSKNGLKIDLVAEKSVKKWKVPATKKFNYDSCSIKHYLFGTNGLLNMGGRAGG